MKSSPCALAAVLAALGLSVWAQVGDGPVPAISPAVPRMARPAAFAAASVATATRMTPQAREERSFLREAAAQSRFELDASKLAFAKSGNSGVRSLAASMINHHNAMGLELAHLLSARGMALPMIGNEQRKALNKLARLTGKKFDTVYMQQVGLAQAEVARDYEKASVAIHDPQLNAWIVRTLPTTRYHLMLAERSLPADPHQARWNRAAITPQAVKAPAPMPQVQPVATTRQGVSASNSP